MSRSPARVTTILKLALVLTPALGPGGGVLPEPVVAQAGSADTLRFAPALSEQRVGSLTPPVSAWVPLPVDDRPQGAFAEAEREGRSCIAVETTGEVVALGRPVPPGPGSTGAAPTRLRWSWFLETGVSGSSLERKEGDDFGARVLVNFRYDPDRAGFFERVGRWARGEQYGVEAPGSAIAYVWSLAHPPGLTGRNPNTDRVATVVVAGAEDAGWGEVTRDVEADYAEVFEDPMPEIVSVVLFSDSDDTGKRTGSCFGEVELIR